MRIILHPVSVVNISVCGENYNAKGVQEISLDTLHLTERKLFLNGEITNETANAFIRRRDCPGKGWKCAVRRVLRRRYLLCFVEISAPDGGGIEKTVNASAFFFIRELCAAC